MKSIKSLILTVALVATAIGASFIPASNSFAAVADICKQNVAQEIKDANGCDGSTTEEAANVVVNAINGAIGILGAVIAIMMIVGGVNYITSAGDATKAEKAKKTILYAVIGAIVCVLAFAITNFVIGILKSA
ncbi:hypothetical protein IJ076_03390 [Candidatus Saccharibacteria bacterium]|nr:hypothetical protein [Candidatus Saccharibacteria bacterium]